MLGSGRGDVDTRSFEYGTFAELAEPEREQLCAELRVYLSYRLAQAEDFYAEISALVQELRARGHGLHNFDEDGECMSIWCPDWTKDVAGLVLTFRAPASVDVSWRAAA